MAENKPRHITWMMHTAKAPLGFVKIIEKTPRNAIGFSYIHLKEKGDANPSSKTSGLNPLSHGVSSGFGRSAGNSRAGSAEFAEVMASPEGGVLFP